MALRRQMTMTLLMLALVLVGAAMVHAESQASIGHFLITAYDPIYDHIKNESTWTYRVQTLEPKRGGLGSIHFGLCTKQQSLLEGTLATIRYDYELRNDAQTHVYGVQFALQQDDALEFEVLYTLAGIWAVANTPVAIAVGQQFYTGTITGPGCLVIPGCSVDFHAEATHLYWNFLRPGVYASQAMVIYVFSANDVVLQFSEFDHAVYLADRTKPALHLAYSIGDTIANADAFGWRDAGYASPDGFNGTQILVTGAEMANGGKEIILWARAYITEENSSSQYEAGGNVSVRSVCP